MHPTCSTDMDSFDFKLRKPEQIIKSIMTKLQKHGKGIVLMHDFQSGTSQALPQLLAELKAGGYKIVHMKSRSPVTTLPQYDAELRRDQKFGAVDERPTMELAGAEPLRVPALFILVSGLFIADLSLTWPLARSKHLVALAAAPLDGLGVPSAAARPIPPASRIADNRLSLVSIRKSSALGEHWRIANAGPTQTKGARFPMEPTYSSGSVVKNSGKPLLLPSSVASLALVSATSRV